jgi:hypothetical protein
MGIQRHSTTEHKESTSLAIQHFLESNAILDELILLRTIR